MQRMKSPTLFLSATLRLALLALIVGSVTSCSLFKKEDEDPPKYKPRPPRDPVEQRVFYSGWRHPN